MTKPTSTKLTTILDYRILALFALGTLAISFFVSKTFWAADDFVFMQGFQSKNLSWQLLTSSYDQHVVPFFILTWWIVNQLAKGNYLWAQIIIISGFILLQYSFYKLIEQFSISKKQKVFLLTIFISSSIVNNNFIWWAAFLSSALPLICVINFFTFAIKYKRTCSNKHLVISILFYIVATLFFEKMAIYSFLAIIYLLFFENYKLSLSNANLTIKKCKYLFIGIIIWTALIVLNYLNSGSIDQVSAPTSPYKILIYIKLVFTKYFTPRIFGLSSNSFTILNDTAILQIFSITVIAIAIALCFKYGKFYTLALGIFLAFTIANESITAYGRLSDLGYRLGNEIRYHLDSYLVFILFLMAILQYVNKNNLSLTKSDKYVSLISIATLIIVLLNIYAMNQITKSSVSYQTKLFYNNLKQFDNTEIVETKINEKYVYYKKYPYNSLHNIQNILKLNIQTVDIGNNLLLPTGKVGEINEVEKLGTLPFLTEEKCSENSVLTVVNYIAEPSEYITFMSKNNLENLVFINATDEFGNSKNYLFTKQKSKEKTFAFTSLYLYEKGTLNITFHFEENTDACIEKINLIKRIEYNAKI